MVFLCADFGAVLLGAMSITFGTAPNAGAWWRFGLLATLGVIYAQLTGRVELLRRYPVADRRPTVDVSTVWLLPAALTLPPVLAATVDLVLVAHQITRPNRRSPLALYRLLFVGAAGLLATLGAATVSGSTGARACLAGSTWTITTALGLVGAVLTYVLVNAMVVVAGFYAVTEPERISQVLLSRDHAGFEAATVVLGLFVAAALAHSPWIVPAVAIIVVMAQRASLVGQLKAEADTDGKTGLLTPAAWERAARLDLQRAADGSRPAAVMMIDLDHFKDFNSQHGHLLGDVALHAVGHCLRSELRGYDAIGRYGGEEFAVVLPNTDIAVAERIATRVRLRIANANPAGIPVTASIGIAHFPRHGHDLAILLAAADAALYTAKDAGRNRVEIAPEPVPPPEPT